ncbi:MAG: type II secretion system protein [Candidatus Saccharibacteria bacterium]|nr:type II secretion system protein [Candidatus Saccharibacteria bacterium]
MKQRMQRINKQRGDTLVEVTIAMAVLGLILASTMAIINRSLLGVMNAVERTSTRMAVDSQVEMLRYVFDTQTGDNRETAEAIISRVGTDAGVISRGCSSSNNGFYLVTNSGTSGSPVKVNWLAANTAIADTVYAAPTAGNGVWVEGVKHAPSGSVPGYIDFYARACWSPYGAREVGQGRIESTVRVYYKGGM